MRWSAEQSILLLFTITTDIFPIKGKYEIVGRNGKPKTKNIENVTVQMFMLLYSTL